MKRFLSGIQIVLVFVFCVSAAVYAIHFKQQGTEEQIYLDCQEEYRIEPKPQDDSGSINLDEPEQQKQAEKTSIDFAALNKVNEDVIGWITIPDTNIDYPIVQGENNTHYLNYGYDGKRNSMGSIFMDYQNQPDFSDRNTALYGHYLYKRQKMFSRLNDYLSEKFRSEHPEFTIVLEDGTEHQYIVFSAYTSKPTSSSFNTQLNEAECASLLQTICEKSVYDTGIIPNTDCRIVTLVCCYAKDFSKRVVVHGMMIS